jgi:ankyrin repeat protein
MSLIPSGIIYAASNNTDIGVARELISAGANANAKDKYGRTPLALAVSSNRNQGVIIYLLEYGAKIAEDVPPHD